MKVIKKYTNRRLYDPDQSSYITLEELAEIIRGGREVRVVDAKSGEDLTQATLAQIVVESRGAARMLPVPLLTQMIRMGDDALAEFMSQYMTFALQMYVQARQGFQGFNPFFAGGFPFQGGQGLAGFFSRAFGEDQGKASKEQPPSSPFQPVPFQAVPSQPAPAQKEEQIGDGEEEIDELRAQLRELTERIDEISKK